MEDVNPRVSIEVGPGLSKGKRRASLARARALCG